MSDTNIVVLGASYAGITIAQYLLKCVLPAIPNNKYHVHIINPTKEFYHRIASPRSMVADNLFPENMTFLDIQAGLTQYGDKVTFTLGKATSVDPAARTVEVQTNAGEHKTIPYHSLVIATGARSQDPVLSNQGDDGKQIHQALKDIREKLRTAKTVVIGGGGPAGIETAGEIAEHFNGKPGWFSKPQPKMQIELVTNADKLIPILGPSFGKRAEGMLAGMGVKTTYKTKITGTEKLESGVTRVSLDDGRTIDADVYINAIGTIPMTDFLPADWLDEKKRVKTNSTTMRVEIAGERVYAVGDVGNHSRGGMINLNDSIPVLGTNMKTDLLAATGVKPTFADRIFNEDTTETQLLTIGQSRGVGGFKGNRMPSMIIHYLKGRDYWFSNLKPTLDGTKWTKEVPFKAVPLKA